MKKIIILAIIPLCFTQCVLFLSSYKDYSLNSSLNSNFTNNINLYIQLKTEYFMILPFPIPTITKDSAYVLTLRYKNESKSHPVSKIAINKLILILMDGDTLNVCNKNNIIDVAHSSIYWNQGEYTESIQKTKIKGNIIDAFYSIDVFDTNDIMISKIENKCKLILSKDTNVNYFGPFVNY